MRKIIDNRQQIEKEAIFIDFKSSAPVHLEQERHVFGKLGAGKAFQAIKLDKHSIKNSE